MPDNKCRLAYCRIAYRIRDRRAERVLLSSEVDPVMREMRRIAAGLRRDAMSGCTRDEQEAFVDALRAIEQTPKLTPLRAGMTVTVAIDTERERAMPASLRA